MDVTTIFGWNCNDEPTEMTSVLPTNLLRDGLARKKIGVKTDALSAVKLDPAVLEAQVTIEAAPNTANNEPYVAIREHSTENEAPPLNLNFEETLTSMHQNSLLNLTSQQCALLMIYVNNLRKQRVFFQKHTECVFCKSNGQSAVWYTGHTLRDRRGRVRCPILRALQCPRCGETGDRAHTLKYCPNNNI